MTGGVRDRLPYGSAARPIQLAQAFWLLDGLEQTSGGANTTGSSANSAHYSLYTDLAVHEQGTARYIGCEYLVL